MQKESKLLIFALLILIFILIIFLNVLIVSYSYLEKKEFPAKLEIGEIPAFDVNATALTFGRLIPGSSSTRNLIIENNYGFPIEAKISSEGEIGKFLIFDRKVLLEINETKKIGISAVIPLNENSSYYSGKILVTIKKVI